MKLILTRSNLARTLQIDNWIEGSIASLQPLLRIDEARVSIEYNHESSPPYRASAHLVVPGPDVHAEGVDHTVRTAFARVMAQLRERAVARAARRIKKRGEKRVLPSYLPAQGARC